MDGTAIIRASASGLSNKDITATEADNDITPPGLFSQNLWVLNNGDPDYSNPPFDDSLKVFNSAGEKILSRGGFNIAQTIGGHRAIAISDDGKVGWIAENVGDRLTIININGDILAEIPRSVSSIDVVASGFSYALTSIGIISGDSILIIDPEGSIVNRAKYGGFDLVVDEEHSSVWIVGSDIKRLNLNLELEMSIDPIEWAAVSVDFDSKGYAWIAERQHSQIPDSKNRILKISPAGSVVDSVDLVNTPFCIRVDRESGDVWIVGFGFIYRYIPDLTELVLIESVGGFSLDIDYTEGLIWIGSYEDVRAYSRDGNLQTTLSDFDGTDIKYVVTSDVRPISKTLDTLPYEEDFTSDVFVNDYWTREDGSVTVNLDSGFLNIASDGSYGDWADHNVEFSLPLTVETRVRLVSGGQNYLTPALEIFFGDNDDDTLVVVFLPDNVQEPSRYGWAFGIQPDIWTHIDDQGPSGENEWVTIRLNLRVDGGELWAITIADADTHFIQIVSKVWDISDTITGFKFSQPWDGVSDVDYIKISNYIITSVEEALTGVPNEFELYNAYPNPFNPSTTINYSLPKQSNISLIIYNLNGQEIFRWNEHDVQAGFYQKTWKGTNKFGVPVGSGIYFYSLQAGDFVQTRKMVLLK